MLKVLIIDDVDYIRKSILRLLEQKNYQCHSAANGKIAMDMVIDNQYDLIITDIMMPEADGYEFMDFLRAQITPISAIPVLAISGGDKTTNSDVALQGLKTKVSGVLQKPFGKSDLMQAIANVLDDNK